MNGVHRPTGDHHPDPDAQAAARVALYTRGYEPSTLDHQEAALRHYLATVQPAWRIVAVYRDTAPAGGWRDIRSGLRSALTDATSTPPPATSPARPRRARCRTHRPASP